MSVVDTSGVGPGRRLLFLLLLLLAVAMLGVRAWLAFLLLWPVLWPVLRLLALP